MDLKKTLVVALLGILSDRRGWRQKDRVKPWIAPGVALEAVAGYLGVGVRSDSEILKRVPSARVYYIPPG